MPGLNPGIVLPSNECEQFMANPNRAARNDDSASGRVTETITYVPGQGDPAAVTWGGHVFHANVPKEITGHPDGTKAEQLNHHLIERARENKTFTVGGKARRRDVRALPQTAEEYRGYFVDWMNQEFNSANDMIARFARDRDLQATCEVGSDDYAYLGSLFMPKLSELAKSDELTEGQVAQLWVNNGINQLPW